MRKLLFALTALTIAAAATPASAQWRHHGHHGWGGGPHFGVTIGGPSFYAPGPYVDYAPGPYVEEYPAYTAECTRERVVRVRPNGTRVVTYVRRCD